MKDEGWSGSGSGWSRPRQPERGTVAERQPCAQPADRRADQRASQHLAGKMLAQINPRQADQYGDGEQE